MLEMLEMLTRPVLMFENAQTDSVSNCCTSALSLVL